MPEITLRFVRGSAITSALIAARGQTAMPFCPSHVECVTPDGKWLGQQMDGGMQARPAEYDKGQVAILEDGREAQIFVKIPVDQAQHDTFYAYMTASIGQPYDFKAILGYAVTFHEHTIGSAICSAKVLLGLRKSEVFLWPVTVPAHLVSPRDLMLMLSTHVEIPH